MAIIRILMMVIVAIYGGYLLLAWGSFFLGDSELILDMLDRTSDDRLTTGAVLIAFAGSLILMISLTLIALATYFHGRAERTEGVFAIGAVRSLRLLAYGLLTMWVSFFMLESLLQLILYMQKTSFNSDAIDFPMPLDTTFVMIVVAAILFKIAHALDTARAIQDDNRQII